jgi:hypothetical protein
MTRVWDEENLLLLKFTVFFWHFVPHSDKFPLKIEIHKFTFIRENKNWHEQQQTVKHQLRSGTK